MNIENDILSVLDYFYRKDITNFNTIYLLVDQTNEAFIKNIKDVILKNKKLINKKAYIISDLMIFASRQLLEDLR